jgi:glutathione S-transferase
MLQFGGSWMDMMLWQIRTHEHILPPDQKDERTITRYRDKFVTEVEPQLRQRLDKQPFICGDNFSAADIVIGHNITWAHLYQLCQDEIFHQYRGRLAERPAFGKAFSDAGDFSPELPERSRPANFSG